jgi:cold shock CspA family protein
MEVNMFGQLVNDTLAVLKNDDVQLSSQDNNKIEGKVKFFNQEKGFGFIYTNKLDDHFFNVKDVDGFDLPNQGDVVEFESNSGKKGLFATQIIITSSAKDEGKTTCPSCNSKVIPRTVHNPRTSEERYYEDFAGSETIWYNAYVSGNCPLCGHEIWSN